MMKRLFSLFPLLLLALVLSSAEAVHAQQPLPPSAWYAVIYQPETDSLRWINADGEQASMPCPTLNNEAQYLDMRLSPDGRTLLLTAQLTSGLQAIGVYNLAAGTFVQTHIAQPGESMHLGGQQIFTADSQYFAVGLSGGDFASPSWRVILFEAQTGAVTAFIDHTHPEAPTLPLSAPSVLVYVTPIGAAHTLTAVPVSQVTVNPPQNPVIVTPTPVQPQQPVVVDCSLTLPTRVSIGSNARVVESLNSLNLRGIPNGVILGQLGAGQVFTVIGGPICEAGFYWWQVNAGGQLGWVAEVSQSDYFIEPYAGPLVASANRDVPAGVQRLYPL